MFKPWLVYFFIGWVCSGLSYLVTLVFDPRNGTIIVTLAIMVFGFLVAGAISPMYSEADSLLHFFQDIAFGR